MTLGFTGTRKGMTQEQKNVVTELTYRLAPRIESTGHTFLHGCAEGGDREFHDIAAGIGSRHLFPIKRDQIEWAAANATTSDLIVPLQTDPIGRNHVMVDLAEAFLAAPYGWIEQTRGSGTWATIRYCRKIKRVLYVVWPDGTVSPG